MATTVRLPLTLGSADSGYSAPKLGKLATPTKQRLLPVGTAFLSHADRVLNSRSLAEHEAFLASEAAATASKLKGKGTDDDEPDDGVGEEPESKALLALDPRDWKNQDQYAVLGLSSLRYKATPDQIKRAHRKKVLRHHPDKKAGQAGNANDDSFFKCIAKAYEVLSDPIKRRQFDSVDEEVDSPDVPSASSISSSPSAFYTAFAPLFDLESRFSVNQPAPELGGPDAKREDVEAFYEFWLTFDSWRSFEWKDKDANEGSDSRNEKRHIENKNRSERERRKKEDNARRRNLVETALASDPRIKSFKAADRAAREAKKKGSSAAASGAATPTAAPVDPKVKAEEEKKKAEEAAQAQAQEKASREAAKKAKEAAKKTLKKESKAISSLLQSLDYLSPTPSPSASHVEAVLGEVDRLVAGLEVEEVGKARKEMEEQKTKGAEEVKRVAAGWAKKAEQQDGKGSFKVFV